MRKVDRSRLPVPSVLQGASLRSAMEKLDAHAALPADTRVKRRAPVEKSIIYNEEVFESLRTLFLGKCAYCESSLSNSEGNVDLFRPVANASNGRDSDSSPDHYFWFAYEWSNYLLICDRCSERKRSAFPVIGRRAEVGTGWEDATRFEQFKLLDPCSDEPRRHLFFGQDGGVRSITKRGEATINLLELNRGSLIEGRRLAIYRCYQTIKDLSAVGRPDRSGFSEIFRPEDAHSGAVFLAALALGKYFAEELGRSKPTSRSLPEFLINVGPLVPDVIWRRIDKTIIPALATGPMTMFPSGPLLSDKRVLIRSSARRLSSIHIENFRGISELDLEVEPGRANVRQMQTPCAMLLGENATGKSSVLQAIALCAMGKAHRDNLRLDPSIFISREPDNWHVMKPVLPRVVLGFSTGEASELRIDQSTFNGSDHPACAVYGYGARRYFDPKRSRRGRNDLELRTLFDPFATISHPEGSLNKLDEHSFNAVARALREIFALRNDDEISRDSRGRILVTAHGRETPIERMSEGYKSLFATAADIMLRMTSLWGNLEDARGIVLIDEIETHLHPRWKQAIMMSLRAALPQIQFVVTTHDPLCLRGMEAGEVQVLERDDTGKIERISDLPDVTALRTDQILTSDFFGLSSTSDPRTESKLARYAELAASDNATLSELDRSELDILRNTLSQTMPIGDTPREQIIYEALERFNRDHPEKRILSRNTVKKDAVEAILSALRASRQRIAG